MGEVIHVLSPEVCLHADDVFGLFGREFGRYGIEVVGLFDGYETVEGQRFVFAIVRLVIV